MEAAFTDEQLSEQISKNSELAEKLLNNEDQIERFLERLENKLQLIPIVGKKLSHIPVLVSLVRSYVRGDYRDIPIGSIIAIVSGLIYVVSTADLLPDIIPALGYVDDAAVIALVLTMVESDVEEYKTWQLENGKKII